MDWFDPKHLAAALPQGIPLFIDNRVDVAAPYNAAPYLVHERHLSELMATTPRKRELTTHLFHLLAAIRAIATVSAVLIGGSCLDRGNDSPNDLDCVIFYSAHNIDPITSVLRQFTADFYPLGIDARFVPTDVDPFVLIKLSCFYAALYSSSRTQGASRKGCLLMVPGK